MKSIVLAGVLAVSLIVPARAGDVPVAVTDAEQESWQVVSELLEKCIAAAMLRGDGAICRNVHGFTVGFAAKVAAAALRAKAPAAPAEGEKK